MEPKADLIITEMRNTRYRQPAWYRYVAGFAPGKPVIIGELGSNLPAMHRAAVLEIPGTRQVEAANPFDLAWLPLGPQIAYSSNADIAVNLQKVDSGVAIHLLRYEYSFEGDRVPLLDEFQMNIHLPEDFRTLDDFGPGELPQARLEVSGDLHHITLKDVPLYCILLLKKQ
jgi:hypothetical protein